jgi:hypothetical protein
MTGPFRVDLHDLREREKAAKAEVLRRFGARGIEPSPGSHDLSLSRKQRCLAKLLAEQERRQ